MSTLKKSKVLVGLFVAGVAALSITAGAAMAADGGQAGGCDCCKKMGQMQQPSSSTGK